MAPNVDNLIVPDSPYEIAEIIMNSNSEFEKEYRGNLIGCYYEITGDVVYHIKDGNAILFRRETSNEDHP